MNKRILIVEDEGIVALELQEHVEALGHSVVGVADTGLTAVELARETRPDLILMDVRLRGEMDGAEAAALIRREADVPIVFLTAYSGDEVMQRALQCEPYAYLIKPIQEQQLHSALRVVWNKHHQDQIMRQTVRRYSSIVRAIPHGIILTDTDLNVRYLNTRAKQLLGVTRTRAVWGKPAIPLLNAEQEEFGAQLRAAVAQVEDKSAPVAIGEFRFRDRKGQSSAHHVEVSAFVDASTQLVGVLIVLTNGVALDPSHAELRSFLELEILRLSLGVEPGDTHARGFRAGQVQGNKRVLRLVFGADAVRELESTIHGKP